MSSWQTIGSRIAYQNNWAQMREDDVIDPSGQKTIYGVFEIPGSFISIAAITDDEKMLLVRQFRYPIQEETWEIVSGRTDHEESETAAARELYEETGYQARTLTKLSNIYLDAGTSSTRGDIFLATDLTKVTEELDAVDGIREAKAFSIDEIRDMIIRGDIRSPHTITAFYLACEHLKEGKYEL